MAFVTLPGDHHDADLELAGRVAAELGLFELHVFTVLPRAERQPAPPRGLVGAVDAFLDRLAAALAPDHPKIGKLRRLARRSTPAWSAATTSRSFRSTYSSS